MRRSNGLYPEKTGLRRTAPVVESKTIRSRYAPGAATLEQIVRAAETVLIHRGHAALTLRSVSEECGIQVGNLTYYFPTKHDLVAALMNSVTMQYQGEMTKLALRDAADAEALLTSTMFYWMKDSQSRRTSRIFVELWSMSASDPYIREEVKKLYLRGRQRYERIFASINPDLSDEECSALATYTISTMEGLQVFANQDQDANVHMPSFAAFAVRSVLHLARKKEPEQLAALAARWRRPDPSGGPR
jgi:AcrR family transcriptional regulator